VVSGFRKDKKELTTEDAEVHREKYFISYKKVN
jgi:hypothetical protein